ncbi:MAG: hypothetical protein ABSE73_22820 [Planctomycetota bacterium]
MNGRHFILLGIVACAGLVSVHDGQKQVELCYQIGGLQKNLRVVRADIELCKIRHRAVQSPRAVSEKAAELQLKVGPVAVAAPAEVREPGLPPSEANRTLGRAQGEKPPSLSVPSSGPRTAQPSPEPARAQTPGSPRAHPR